MNNLALIYVERRDFARAIPMLEEAGTSSARATG